MLAEAVLGDVGESRGLVGRRSLGRRSSRPVRELNNVREAYRKKERGFNLVQLNNICSVHIHAHTCVYVRPSVCPSQTVGDRRKREPAQVSSEKLYQFV